MRYAFALGLLVSSTASGQVSAWDNPSGGDWFNASNWSPASVPDTAGESAVLGLGMPYTVTLSSSIDIDAVDVLNAGATIDILSGTTFAATTVVVDGKIRVNPLQGASTTTLDLDGAVPLSGAGLVELFSRADQATPNSRLLASGAVLEIASGSEIRGSGVIEATSFNRTLVLDGVVRALPGFGAADLVVSDRFSTLDLTGGGELIADGWALIYRGGLVRGGTLREINGGTFGFVGSTTFEGVSFDFTGPLEVPTGAEFSLTGGTVPPSGTVVVNPSQGTSTTTLLVDDALTPVPALTELFSRTDQASPSARVVTGLLSLEIPSGSEIRGSGVIEATSFNRTLINMGTIRAVEANGAAPLVVSSRFSSYVQDAGATLVALVEPGGARTTRIEADAPQLDGTLRVEFASGYTPAFGDIAEIFTSRGTGVFHTLDLPLLPEPLVSRVRYINDGVFYVVSCRADVDGDGLIDFFDVLGYLDAFDRRDPSADLAAPAGVFDFFDVVTFLSQFDAGC